AVDISDESNHRLSSAVAGNPGGGNPGYTSLHHETALLQDVGDVLGCFVLLKAELAETEDLVDHLLRQGTHLLHPTDRFALQIIKVYFRLRPCRLLRPTRHKQDK